MMDTFSKKKNAYIPDSEGEEDSSCLGTIHCDNVYSHRLNSKNMSYEVETDLIDVISTTRHENSSIVVSDDSVLKIMNCKNGDKERISKKGAKYKDSERSLSPFSENNSRNMDSETDMYPMINTNESDDEIQLLGKSNQNKIGIDKDIKKESILSLEEGVFDKDVQMSQLYQQEKPEIQLLSLAACINIDSLDENKYKCDTNKNKSILSKENESDFNLKHLLSKETKAKKFRRSKTAKDVLKEDKNIKIKRYSSLDSYEDHMTTINDTPLDKNSEFENRLFKTVPDENTLDFNKSFPTEDFDCHCSGFNAGELSPSNYDSISNDNFAEIDLIISEKSKYKVQNLKKPKKNIELNAKKSPKILRSCESNLLSKIEDIKKKDIENADMDLLNSENKIKDYSKFNNEKPMSFAETPDITNSSTSMETLSVLKESTQKNVITKLYYRVGLSKKAKIESLHSYLKR